MWISQQDVQKPTAKPLVEVVAVEICVELEGDQLREMLRRGSGRRDGPAGGPGSLPRSDREIAASTPTTITVVVSSQHVSKSRMRNLATRIMLGGGPATSPALARPT